MVLPNSGNQPLFFQKALREENSLVIVVEPDGQPVIALIKNHFLWKLDGTVYFGLISQQAPTVLIRDGFLF